MKTFTYSLLIFLSILCFMNSCSDDKDTASAYEGTYLGSNLELSINNVQMKNRVLGINENGSLILQYIIPGQAVVDVPLTKVGDWLEGSANFTHGSVSARGIVKSGKMMMDLTIKVENSLIGTWHLAPYELNEKGGVISSPIFLSVQPADALINIDGKEIPVSIICELIEKNLGKYAQVLSSITFRDDTFIAFTLKDNNVETSSWGIMQYYVKDNLLYILPNLTELFLRSTYEVESRSEVDMIVEVLNLLTEGIPLAYVEDNGTLKVFTTKDLIMPYLAIMNELLPLLPEDNSWVKLIKDYFPQVEAFMNGCTQFDFGIALTKVN